MLLIVMFASMWRAPALSRWVSQTHYLISIKRGRVSFKSVTILATGLDRRWVKRTVGRFSPGIDFAPDWDWGSNQRGNTAVIAYPLVESRYIFIPIWPFLLLIAAPTAWLWRTDRRAKPWQCTKCRYDLRGLEGGVCPECGHKLKPSIAEGVAD